MSLCYWCFGEGEKAGHQPLNKSAEKLQKTLAQLWWARSQQTRKYNKQETEFYGWLSIALGLVF